MEAYNRPLGSEHPHSVSVLQDGDQWISSQSPAKRAMAHRSGFERRLLSYPYPPLLQAVPSVLQFRWQFRALPFGLNTAPRVFTMVTAPIVAYAYLNRLSLHIYLDDWLLNPISEELAKQQTQWLLDICTRLGWVVNVGKSNFTPSQVANYLGISVDTRVGLAYHSKRRI